MKRIQEFATSEAAKTEAARLAGMSEAEKQAERRAAEAKTRAQAEERELRSRHAQTTIGIAKPLMDQMNGPRAVARRDGQEGVLESADIFVSYKYSIQTPLIEVENKMIAIRRVGASDGPTEAYELVVRLDGDQSDDEYTNDQHAVYVRIPVIAEGEGYGFAYPERPVETIEYPLDSPHQDGYMEEADLEVINLMSAVSSELYSKFQLLV